MSRYTVVYLKNYRNAKLGSCEDYFGKSGEEEARIAHPPTPAGSGFDAEAAWI